jgi:hypothetical protein
MYANPFTADFNPHRHYAFLRKYEGELLLIVANFDAHDTDVKVHIPTHAFDYFKLPTLYSIEATELLTGTPTKVTLHPDSPVALTLPGYSGVILKLQISEN